MSELGRDARAFLATARGAHEPASGAKERVRGGLAGTLAGAGVGAALASGAPVVRGTWIAGAKLAAIMGVGICGIGAALLFGRAPVDASVGVISNASDSPRLVNGNDSPRLVNGSDSPRLVNGSDSPRLVNGSDSPRLVNGSDSPRLVNASPLPPVARPASSHPAGAAPGEAIRASVSSNAPPGTASPANHSFVPTPASPSSGTDRTDRAESPAGPIVAEVEASSLPRAPSLPAPRAVANPHAPAGEGSVEAEVRILRRASAALRAGDPKGALTAVREHARRFPHGALAEEREVERIVALCALGRTDEAARMTTRFERSYPSSSHEARIRGACGVAAGVAP